MVSLEKYFDQYGTGAVVKIAHFQNNSIQIKTLVEGYSMKYPSTKKMEEDSIFDITSLTKLYTSILIHKAVERNLFTLETFIYEIDHHFIYLKDVTILDLLAHRLELWTDGYLGNAKNKEEFYQILYGTTVKSRIHKYTDSHYIILGVLLEHVYQLTYADIVTKDIINPLQLKHTYFDVTRQKKVVSCNFGKFDGKIIDSIDHICFDKKASRAAQLHLQTGHAGIFTTATDLLKILISFLDEKENILKVETIHNMLKHDDYFKYVIDYEQNKEASSSLIKPYNYGGLRYQIESELSPIPFKTGENTVILNGYTGPIFLIDFTEKKIVLIMCNVCHLTEKSRSERLNAITQMLKEEYESIK